ncbi:protein D2-like [Copidosoma floridanum]|uniref:protein D2-like n=1 Tax=Copidosoma floridanum TaxID=29053 RepID=UPI0006C950E2|nr:protein D2-like [Copidosoma floridanum]
MRFIVGIFVCTLSIAAADVASDFISEEIVPDALDTAPNQLISLAYKGKAVKFGEELLPTDVIEQPTLEWNVADPSSYYTLIMTNIDPSSRQKPIYREFLHWLVVNVPGDDVSKGETIAEYVGAGPPKNGGVHRMLFTVYKQPDKLTFTEAFMHNRQLGIRLRFSQKNYSDKYNLGDPVAGMMYTSRYDDYVPQLHSEFMKGVRV